jgi:hypothetical protein
VNQLQNGVKFQASAEVGPEVVRSPVTGEPCVHWRLRIVEHLTARSALVHEIASSESFVLAWGQPGSGGTPARIRIEPETSRIEGTPHLYRTGTPGAEAVARAFGFVGAISVEEVAIRPGDDVVAEGTLIHLDDGAGPFRSVRHEPELLDAVLQLPSRSLGPALLPWAFGTAAALIGGVGLATWAAWRYHGLHQAAAQAQRGGHSPAHLTPPDFPRPLLP